MRAGDLSLAATEAEMKPEKCESLVLLALDLDSGPCPKTLISFLSDVLARFIVPPPAVPAAPRLHDATSTLQL